MSRLLTAALAALSLGGLAVAQDTSDTPAPRLPAPAIDDVLHLEYQSVPVLGSTMTYLEMGEGDPVLFIHGNPTSAYLWRNILPIVGEDRRVIAVDLIGMGQSGKPDLDYSFTDHALYLAAFVEALGLEEFTVVGHDWGAALAWDYTLRHPDRVTGIAFMEGVLPPTFPQPSFDAMGPEMGGMFRMFKDPVLGEQNVIGQNMFVEQVLPMLINRPLSETAMEAYRAPFLQEEDRWPTLAWPREVPIAGTPATTVDRLNDIAVYMGEIDKPVLLLYADPGVIVPRQAVDWYVETIPGLETGFVGQGLHFIQEDQPVAIGRAIQDWLRRTEG
ncbi:haloalkane dehalogenase [Maricaulis sp. D1M11]|uniref:haloalkane dehalogenase n=1 Tax=Maricaulis sp. D1M11 TaxID=3076117 RepID=UPI0039B481A7